jgi:hypothetical protein
MKGRGEERRKGEETKRRRRDERGESVIRVVLVQDDG